MWTTCVYAMYITYSMLILPYATYVRQVITYGRVTITVGNARMRERSVNRIRIV